MKIGVLAAHFPPHGHVSSRRPYFTARILKDLGHDVTVFTSDLRFASNAKWNPNTEGLKIVTLKHVPLEIDESSGVLEKVLLLCIRFFGTLPFGVGKRLKDLSLRLFFPFRRDLNLKISEDEFTGLFGSLDWIIASGAPWSLFDLAVRIKTISNIKIALDYRDPWNAINEDIVLDSLGRYNSNFISRYIQKRNLRLEKEILNNADLVTTVSQPIAENIKRVGNKANVSVIYNGFSSIEQLMTEKINLAGFNISYTGTYRKEQKIERLFDALETLFENSEYRSTIKVNFIGVEVSSSVKPILKPFYEFKNKYPHNVFLTGFLDRDDVARYQNSSHMLLHLNYSEKNGILSSKLFQYLGVGRTILFISDTFSFSEKLVESANAGKVCSSSVEISDCIKTHYENWKTGSISSEEINLKEINKYSFEAQVGNLEAILKKS